MELVVWANDPFRNKHSSQFDSATNYIVYTYYTENVGEYHLSPN